MTLTPRADERKALVELLEQDWEDADALAGALLKRAFELLQSRTLYGLRWNVGGGTLAVGPFAQERDAERWHKGQGGEGAVALLHGPGRFPRPEKTAPVVCTCGHPKGTHDHAKGKGWCWANTKDKNNRKCDCTQYVADERKG